MKNRFLPILVLVSLAGGLGFSGTLAAAPDFWEADVWSDPKRPFLYYGEDLEDVRPKLKEPRATERFDDFSRFTTVEALRKEYERRKDEAILHPENESAMLALLAITDHLQNRAQRFAEGWERTRLTNPVYDWTATHPLVNQASGELKAERDDLARRMLANLAKEAGLVWIADASQPLSHTAAPLVSTFAKVYGFELLVVEKTGRPLGLDPVVFRKPKPDLGIGSRLGADASETLPALYLVPKPDTPYPTLQAIRRSGGALRFATGAVSVTKMASDLLFLLVPNLERLPKALPSERIRALESEWRRTKNHGNNHTGEPVAEPSFTNEAASTFARFSLNSLQTP